MNWGFEPEYRSPQIAISESKLSKLVGLYANTAVQGEEQGVEQIKFEEGDEWMRQMFADECAKSGVKVDMG